MACSSLQNLPRTCTKYSAGVLKLYLIAFSDLAPLLGTEKVYALSEDGEITNIGLKGGKSFVEVGVLTNTVGLTEKMTRDLSKATRYYTNSFSLILAGLTKENRAFVQSILPQPVAIIIKTRMGQFLAAGLNTGLDVTEFEGGTGVLPNDLYGYKLTFSGTDTMLIPTVDPAVIEPAEFFNYQLKITPGENNPTETEIHFKNP